MDFKKINYVIIIGGILSLIISFLPIINYYFHFKNSSLSDLPSDWGAFGEYLGGTSGTVLSFFAVIFSLISLYFTTRIARTIQDNEFNFNEKQSAKQLEVLYLQNKPFPYLDLVKYQNETRVTLQNNGPGTLIVKKWVIKYLNNQEYSNFHKLLDDKLIISGNGAKISFNTAETHVLAPSKEKNLLNIVPSLEYPANFPIVQKAIRQILKDAEVIIEFEDIFSNRTMMQKDMSFFQ